MEDLTGFLELIVFFSEDTGFTVARLKAPRFHDLVTIVGTLPGVQPGERLSCRGTWKHHSQYGRQFEIENYHLEAPADEVGIEKIPRLRADQRGRTRLCKTDRSRVWERDFRYDRLDMIDRELPSRK